MANRKKGALSTQIKLPPVPSDPSPKSLNEVVVLLVQQHEQELNEVIALLMQQHEQELADRDAQIQILTAQIQHLQARILELECMAHFESPDGDAICNWENYNYDEF